MNREENYNCWVNAMKFRLYELRINDIRISELIDLEWRVRELTKGKNANLNYII